MVGPVQVDQRGTKIPCNAESGSGWIDIHGGVIRGSSAAIQHSRGGFGGADKDGYCQGPLVRACIDGIKGGFQGEVIRRCGGLGGRYMYIARKFPLGVTCQVVNRHR